MPMLHSCSFAGCDTRTLSTYCLEHEVVVRAKMLAERMEAAEACDEPLTGAPRWPNPGLSAA